jgi:hypothetical protein
MRDWSTATSSTWASRRLVAAQPSVPSPRRTQCPCSRPSSRDIDLFEFNEAFASVVLAWAREIGADLDRVNVNGGAIALGHPLGASGARLTATLLNALEQRNGHFGLQVICEAGGLANAMAIERLPEVSR